MSVYVDVNSEFLKDLFHLPLTQQAFLEYESFEIICNEATLTMQRGNYDNWS